MSAAEIITVMKAINDHVTNKYCDAIVGYLNEKTNAHLLFERQFFNSMDQSVQKLVNEITGALKPTSSSVGPISSVSKNILSKIQKHCNKYNQKKKNMYDNHLVKIKEFEQKLINIIEQTLKEKVIHQNNLFDTAITSSVTQQNVNQDIITLLSLFQNTQNTQNNVTNGTNQVVQPANTQSINIQHASNNIQNSQYVQNAPNTQNIQNTFKKISNSQSLSITPTQTPSVPKANMQKQNNVTQLNQINQFLSFLSQPNVANSNDNVSNDNTTNSTISAQNGHSNVLLGTNNDNNTQNILNNINSNGVSHSQNNNNLITSNNSNNSTTNNMNNTNPPPLPPIPLNTRNDNTKNGNIRDGNTHNNHNSSSNNSQCHLQLKNLIAPINYGNTKAPLPIQPRKIPTLTIPTTNREQMSCNSINTSVALNNRNNSPTNILPSFPNNKLKSATTDSNTKRNVLHANSRNIHTGQNSDVISQNSGSQFLTNRNGKSLSAQPTVSLAPTAPPKPPPPPKTHEYYESSTDMSSIGDDNDSDRQYECTLCNTFFNTAQEWKYHLKKSHLTTRPRQKKSKKTQFKNMSTTSKNSKHRKKSKHKRKRVFSQLNNVSNGSNGKTFNKRRRQTFPCELCNKQFSRLSSYIKHYNHHMITNENNMCNFCLNQFINQNELKKHIATFGAGISIQYGDYQCCQCRMTFANKNKLQSHINGLHMNTNKVNSLKMLQLFSLRGIKKSDKNYK